MTTKERDFWWRLTHKTIQTRKRESKWKKDKNGMAIESTCPICKEEESWDHCEYDCKGMMDMNEKVAQRLGRAEAFSRQEWRLEVEDMEEQEKMSIATARWIYHCERCKIANKKKKRLNTQTLMNRWHRRMTIAN